VASGVLVAVGVGAGVDVDVGGKVTVGVGGIRSSVGVALAAGTVDGGNSLVGWETGVAVLAGASSIVGPLADDCALLAPDADSPTSHAAKISSRKVKAISVGCLIDRPARWPWADNPFIRPGP
jgi:hypothetical protein